MEIAELVLSLEGQGAVLAVDGDRVRLRAPSDRAPSPEVLERLRGEKAALIAYLRARTIAAPSTDACEWPTRSLDAKRRFSQQHASLFTFIGRKVQTPNGPGTLLQVFVDRATVLLDSDREHVCVRFLPSEVIPIAPEQAFA